MLLRQFTARSGRIVARRKTGVCAKHQRILAKAIKRARHIALLPYTASHTRSIRP
jgi:small subunit ribosomal protein S18